MSHVIAVPSATSEDQAALERSVSDDDVSDDSSGYSLSDTSASSSRQNSTGSVAELPESSCGPNAVSKTRRNSHVPIFTKNACDRNTFAMGRQMLEEIVIASGWAQRLARPEMSLVASGKLEEQQSYAERLGLVWSQIAALGVSSSSFTDFGEGNGWYVHLVPWTKGDESCLAPAIAQTIVKGWTTRKAFPSAQKSKASQQSNPSRQCRHSSQKLLRFGQHGDGNGNGIVIWSSESVDVYRWLNEAPEVTIPEDQDFEMIFATRQGRNQYSFYTKVSNSPDDQSGESTTTWRFEPVKGLRLWSGGLTSLERSELKAMTDAWWANIEGFEEGGAAAPNISTDF